jgi:D-glycero-alpha-D-manno-heptose 1-phosphate guanylyltransferase
MAPVAGRPFLCYLFDHLEAQGIERIILSVGYRHEAISAFFGREYGSIKVDYAIEDQPLGTGGGISAAIQQTTQRFTFVLNGDTFLKLDYRVMAARMEHSGATPLAVALRKVHDAGRYGRASIAGDRITGFSAAGDSGSCWVNAGVYLMERTLFERYPVPAKFSFESDFLEPRAPEIWPLAFPCDAPFIDIGIPESLQQAQSLLPVWIRL